MQCYRKVEVGVKRLLSTSIHGRVEVANAASDHACSSLEPSRVCGVVHLFVRKLDLVTGTVGSQIKKIEFWPSLVPAIWAILESTGRVAFSGSRSG
jgi:hypothetical protein